VRIKRKLLAYGAALVVAAGSAALVVPTSASAHGAPLIPGSRTWLCYRDGLTPQGNIVPRNPACAAAVAQSGDNSLYNWFGVLRSDAAGRTTGFVPDGQLCSGGNSTYSGYNLGRNDWPVTHLTGGRSIEIRYNNWARHPGTFFAYVTRDGWSPTQPLRWSDLESQPFSTATDPPERGGPGTNDGHYWWNATLPNKSGRHIIYMRWVRSDSAENFFSCSDVVFDGGNGEVTGIGGTGGPTGGPSSSPTTPGPGPGTGSCTVSVAITNSWSGGFQAEGTVRAGTSAVNGWTVTLTNPSGQGVSQVWNASMLGSSGSTTQIRNTGWNGSIAANGSTTFGFIGTSSGASTAPSATCSSP
jgi:predicted carbohydrate-binding protein with CBM5 and CBM33 domain